jgi:hypothetical protein
VAKLDYLSGGELRALVGHAESVIAYVHQAALYLQGNGIGEGDAGTPGFPPLLGRVNKHG